MNKRQRIHNLLETIASTEIPNTSHPWAAIRARLAQQQSQSHKSFVRVRVLQPAPVALLLLLVIGIGVFLSAPPARAAVTDIFQRFGLAFIIPSEQEGTQTVTSVAPTPATTRGAMLTLAEAQQRVPFAIAVPRWTPDHVSFVGAFVSETTISREDGTSEPKVTVVLRYQSSNSANPSALLQLEIVSGSNAAPYLLLRSREQTISLQGQPATYVQGGWSNDGKGDAREKLGDLTWDDTADSSWLSWQARGLTYILSAHGLQLDKAAMVRIAESLR